MNVEQISSCFCSSVVYLIFRTPSAVTLPDTCRCSEACPLRTVLWAVSFNVQWLSVCPLKYRFCASLLPKYVDVSVPSWYKFTNCVCAIRVVSASIDTCAATLGIWLTKVSSKMFTFHYGATNISVSIPYERDSDKCCHILSDNCRLSFPTAVSPRVDLGG